MVVLLNTVDVEPVKRNRLPVSGQRMRVERVHDREVVQRIPLEQQFAGLDINLLKQVVVDPAIHRPSHCSHVGLCYIVDGDERRAVFR